MVRASSDRGITKGDGFIVPLVGGAASAAWGQPSPIALPPWGKRERGIVMSRVTEPCGVAYWANIWHSDMGLSVGGCSTVSAVSGAHKTCQWAWASEHHDCKWCATWRIGGDEDYRLKALADWPRRSAARNAG